ncbi:hypothetical protein [Clostridium aestuarii]|nr:hypothetical protein [Clostridium aestuarii]
MKENINVKNYDVDFNFGGVNLKKITCVSLFSNISTVFQNVYLFNDTI